MNCDEVQSKLSEYFEDLQDPETTARISNHLSACDRCRTEADELTQTVQLVNALPEVDPPAGFATRVMARIKEPASEPRFWQRFFFPFHIKLPIHAAAVILVSILAAYVYHKEPQQRQLQIGEAELDGLKQDERYGSAAPEFRASVPTTKKNEALAKKQAPKVPASASPPVAVGQSPREKTQESLSYRLDAPPAAPQRPPQEKSSLRGKISGGRGLPGSATELRDKLGTTPLPNEGSRDAKSSVGAATTGAKTNPTASATEGETAGGNTLDRSAAQERYAAPKSPPMTEASADFELFIRLRPATSENKISAEGLASRQLKNARTSILSAAQKSDLDKAGQRATETQEAQTLWLSIPRSQWARVKTDLATFGQIESEAAAGSQAEDEVSKAGAPLRVKVTVLPPLSTPAVPAPR